MKRSILVVTTLAILLFAIEASLEAQRGPGRGPMTMGHYNPKAEVTFQGTVEEVNRLGEEHMPGMGMHLTVKNGNESMEVHLGPVDFVEKTMTFKEGDTVQITGSKVTMMGEQVVIAREIKKGDQVLKLRDPGGIPLWSGGRRRS
jgi:hypothetical protein